MFIWRGFGFVVVVVTFGVLLLTELGVERHFSDDTYYQAQAWPKLLGFVVSAVLIWLLANYLEHRPARVVIDKATGEEIKLGAAHDLFFVPLKYWPAILLAAGVGFMIFGVNG